MLTDEQIDEAWRSVDYKLSYDDFRIALGRAIEAEVLREIEAQDAFESGKKWASRNATYLAGLRGA